VDSAEIIIREVEGDTAALRFFHFFENAFVRRLLLQGFSIWHFKLSDNVLLAAIGSTTANVIGMLVIVLRHLVPSRDNPE
jgi:hypothetical protein